MVTIGQPGPSVFLVTTPTNAGKISPLKQKIDYIHDNPVHAGLVYRAEDYIYSSAANYAGVDQIIEVGCLFY